MFVSVLERFGGRIELVWEEKYCIIWISVRGPRIAKQWPLIRISIILLEHKQIRCHHGPKTKKICQPFRLRGVFCNTKATLVFFHFLQVFHVLMSLWWLTIAFGISSVPWCFTIFALRAFVGIAGDFGELWQECGVILTNPWCVARWWTSGYFRFVYPKTWGNDPTWLAQMFQPG